jgi:hypothetical protein
MHQAVQRKELDYPVKPDNDKYRTGFRHEQSITYSLS